MLKFLDEHFEAIVVVVLMVLMTVLIGVQVFMRYVMGASLSWSEELARYFFIWMTYIGVAYAVRERAHIKVTMLTDRLPAAINAWVPVFTGAIFAGFALFVMYQGWFFVEKIFRFGQKSASLGIPMGYVYLAPLTGFALVSFRLVQMMVIDTRAALGEGDAQ